MKHFIFLVTLLFSSCGVLWRSTLYNKPNVGDNMYFPKYYYHSNVYYAYPFVQRVTQPIVDVSKTKTDFLIEYENDTIYLLYGDISKLNEPYQIFSITKSVLGLLYGIALSEGAIESLDDTLPKYYARIHKSLNKVTIRDLLQMRSGINNDFLLEGLLYYGTNLKWSVAQARVEDKNKGKFDYSDCSTQLLSFILERATGKKN